MKNVIENYRSDYGLLSSTNLPYLKYNCKDSKDIIDNNLFPAYNSDPDTLNNMSFGTGAIANIRQDIGHSIRHGFGRENGSFFPRSLRRRFNIEFQRGCYNKSKFGCASQNSCGQYNNCGAYAYESGLPESYYPRTYLETYPYSQNLDLYPYHDDVNNNVNNDDVNNDDIDQVSSGEQQIKVEQNENGKEFQQYENKFEENDEYNNPNWIIIAILIFVGYFLFFRANRS